MRREPVVKGRSLGGSSDLTLLAAIKPGFVESLETITYKTRIKRLLEALHGGRKLSHEHATARFLSDSVERVGVIHSVRVAVLEPEDKVLLAVTFDGPWEAYIRVLWDKVGTLLDLIFVDTVDHVTAADHGFEAWRAWAERVQVETGFFYGPAESTARDAFYWRRIERMRERLGAALVDPAPERGDSEAERLERFRADRRAQLRAALPSAEDAVDRFTSLAPHAPADEPAYRGVLPPRMLRECVRYGLRGLASLYRLTDLYRPGTREGEVLRRAARDLLREFVDHYAPTAADQIAEARHGKPPGATSGGRFARPLDWLLPEGETPQPPGRLRAPPSGERLAPDLLAAVQGGIVRPYADVTHGLIAFVAFDGAAGAATFAQWARTQVTRGDHAPATVGGTPFCNLALTVAGLRAMGLDDDELDGFPEEFRIGMAARAGLLGDVRDHHPLRWRLPAAQHAPGSVVDPATAHAAVLLRCRTAPGTPEDAAVELADPRHPLRPALAALEAMPHVRVVAVQPMKRLFADDARSQIEEHFGFVDGNGQPDLEAASPRFGRNLVHLGEVLIGQETASDARTLDAPDADEAVRARLHWQGNGSFLVMRKYRQYVGRLRRVVDAVATEQIGGDADAARELVLAKMMGRWRDGAPVADAPGAPPRNNFSYDDDDGRACPLGAHVRLANPRAPRGTSARVPRLMRRSMSYGPRFAADAGDEVDRGIVFMCCVSSIAEQYEVVQRWLSGGNATGTSSGQGCPFLGVADNGVQKTFRFEYADAAATAGATRLAQVDLDPATTLFEEPSPLARLEWGAYLFSPSIAALERLAARATALAASGACPTAVPWRPARGRGIIAALRRLEQDAGADAARLAWKAALEDADAVDRLDTAALWAAVRDDHGGVLRTPYGTLVASRALLREVLRDRDSRYTMARHFARMETSFGGVALGLDAGADYWAQADPVNAAIERLNDAAPGDATFRCAFDAARRRIGAFVDDARQQSLAIGDARFDAGFDIREVLDEVLASLSDAWFGLQDASDLFVRGAVDWRWQPGDPPSYPGQLTALSRYIFQPQPGPVALELGEAYGQALRTAMRRFVARLRAHGPDAVPEAPDGGEAPIAAAVFRHPTHGHDEDFVARTMVGVLMGFTPTLIGAVLGVLKEWFAAGEVLRLRAALRGRTDLASARAVVEPALAAAARMRPTPALLWRTVRTAHALGPAGQSVALEPGDTVVLGLVSGTQQSLADGGDPADDCRLMFGGRRGAAGTGRDHPTHACPGHGAALQAMLGTLTALLTAPEALRVGAGFTAFSIEGPSAGPRAVHPGTVAPGAPRSALGAAVAQEAVAAVDPVDQDAPGVAPHTVGAVQATAAAGPVGSGVVDGTDAAEAIGAVEGVESVTAVEGAESVEVVEIAESVEVVEAIDRTMRGELAAAVLETDIPAAARASAVRTSPRGRSGLVAAWGDSWLGYRTLDDFLGREPRDLRDFLERFGYRAPEGYCRWLQWSTLQQMSGRTAEFCDWLTSQAQTATDAPLRAVLLSGGGNDVVGATLQRMLAPWTPALADPFRPGALDACMAALERRLLPVVDDIARCLDDLGAVDVPIVLHGYDDPFPLGKPWGPRRCTEWLVDPFEAAGYALDHPQGFGDAVAALRQLMARFGDTLGGVAAARPGRVRRVDLRGTIEACWPGHAADHWDNDLHPAVDAFEQLAIRIDDAIVATAWP